MPLRELFFCFRSNLQEEQSIFLPRRVRDSYAARHLLEEPLDFGKFRQEFIQYVDSSLMIAELPSTLVLLHFTLVNKSLVEDKAANCAKAGSDYSHRELLVD
jgi:hypothetical protein